MTFRSTSMTLTLAAMLLLTGCGGHGQHTAAFKAEAQERMAQLKAATQWDMAQQQFLSGDLNKSLKSVDQSIAIAPKVAKSHLLRGRVLIEMGRLEAALVSVDKAIELKPEEAESHYYRGIIFERFSNAEEALTNYRAAIEHDTTDPQYVVAAAEMLILLDRLDEAKTLLDQGRSDFRYNAGIRQTLGHIALIRNDLPAAVAEFKDACTLDPDDIALLEDLARAQMKTGDYADAEYSLRRVLDDKASVDRNDLKLLHAEALINIDRPVQARDILLGLSSHGSGVNDPLILAALGQVSAQIGDVGRLQQCASRLISVAPAKPDGYVLFATWQQRRGDLASAVSTLDKAIERAGADPRPALLQGVLNQQLGRTESARQSFNLALAADPASDQAKRFLATLDPTTSPAVAEVELP